MSFVELGVGLFFLAMACLIGCLVTAAVMAMVSSGSERRRRSREQCVGCHRVYCVCANHPVGGEQAGL